MSTKTIDDLRMACYREYNNTMRRQPGLRGRIQDDEVVSEAYISAAEDGFINPDGTIKEGLSIARRAAWSTIDAVRKANNTSKQTQPDGTQRHTSRVVPVGNICATMDLRYAGGDHTEIVDEQDELEAQLKWVLKNTEHLSQRDKTILGMSFKGASIAEIADKLGMSKGEVKSRKGYHVERLKALVRKQMNTPN